jgi:hypothetical protein
MSQISLNDKIQIYSSNQEYNGVEGFITFLSSDYLRIYADDGSDILIPLNPYDETFGIEKLDIIQKASNENIIKQNGLVEGKFVYFRKKNSSIMIKHLILI